MKFQRAWIIYSWIVIVAFTLDTLQKLRGLPSLIPGPYYVNAIRAISIIALFGFSYQKKIAARRLWQVFFVLHSYLVFKLFIIFSKIAISDISVPLLPLVLLIDIFIYIPVYYANFSYAFISKEIWEKHA